MTAAPADVVVTGVKGDVVRVSPNHRTTAIPGLRDSEMVDAWVMPGSMHVITVRGIDVACDGHVSYGGYALILAYVDTAVRDKARAMGISEGIALDVWLFHPLDVLTAQSARNVTRHLARAAANGTVDFEPIRPEQRDLWKVAADALCAVVAGSGGPDAAFYAG